MPWRKPPRDIAKVGVEGSNPFARSKFPYGNQSVEIGPPRGGPLHFVLTFPSPKKCRHYVSSSAKAGGGLGVLWRAYEAGSKAVWMAATTALPPLRECLDERLKVIGRRPAGADVAKRTSSAIPSPRR
jgi:hypothetical protein